MNDALTNLAAGWAQHLATTGVLAHRDLNGVGGWTYLGETIVQGSCGISDDAVVNLWMNSPPHRDTMLSPVYTSAGVARACAADGREWVVADFGG
ncbi:MAG: CAP domain-containing protein [Acidimicrobiia bacterium]|nr:CAP domain-containing protein [Acidimicrobiia bacterium]